MKPRPKEFLDGGNRHRLPLFPITFDRWFRFDHRWFFSDAVLAFLLHHPYEGPFRYNTFGGWGFVGKFI